MATTGFTWTTERDYVQQLLEDFEDDRQMFIIDPTL